MSKRRAVPSVLNPLGGSWCAAAGLGARIIRQETACRPLKAPGFTLVELLVVMSVLAILSALAVPRLVDRSSLLERGAQAELRGLLVQARQLAMAQQREVCVRLTPAQVSLVYTAGGACSALAADAVRGADGLPASVSAPSRVSFSGADLRFTPRGQPNPNVTQTLSVGSLSITVEAETGLPH